MLFVVPIQIFQPVSRLILQLRVDIKQYPLWRKASEQVVNPVLYLFFMVRTYAAHRARFGASIRVIQDAFAALGSSGLLLHGFLGAGQTHGLSGFVSLFGGLSFRKQKSWVLMSLPIPS